MWKKLKSFLSWPTEAAPEAPEVCAPAPAAVRAVPVISWPRFLELLDVAGGIERMREAGFGHHDVRQAFRRWRKNRGWLDYHIERMIDRAFGLPVTPRAEGGDDGPAVR